MEEKERGYDLKSLLDWGNNEFDQELDSLNQPDLAELQGFLENAIAAAMTMGDETRKKEFERRLGLVKEKCGHTEEGWN